ncbi:MAG TPA: UDP-N-acetylmuramate--L-alanine ligase [Bacteroidales bacterium]|nr:UDP-N-acetylmuramate--L-alanine ligase [Bacteroidales bacterium]HRW94772.1 UDP-N-acetylmuramate--L-alanine ligase [Bacteroidales bacterium]
MIENVYFLGIGGIGMSALARYYKKAGARVAGYDLTPTALTSQLESEGVCIHYTDDPSLIPEHIRKERDKTLVVFTPAVPEEHKELQWFREQRFDIIKRSVALGRIAQNHKTLAVAGTHGKTTTSTLLAHIMQVSGTGCTAFLGGISKNYGSNLLLSDNTFLVAEADEYDRSFLQLFPQTALITSADADHLDIYGSHRAVQDAFAQFASQIVPGGSLVLKKGVSLPLSLQQNVNCFYYHYNIPCDFYTTNQLIREGGLFTFDLILQNIRLKNCHLGIPGQLNVENAVGAAALAYLNGISADAIKEALASFRGVARRMDVQYRTKRYCYIDDYAHHPREIQAAVQSLREWFPQEKITGIFQPHLYSRTRDFAREFAQSLDLLDRVILMPVYPAREKPIPGVGAEMIAEMLTVKEKEIRDATQIIDCIKKYKPGVLVTLGAGNIDRLVQPITACLKEMDV